jgi:MoaA/NifB/PqqE/SkfB family radical SAM enzyme
MYVDINTAGCTNSCRHCAINGNLPFDKFYGLDELRAIKNEWGALTIRFEPTAHPNFPDIYSNDIAADHGGWLVTNGFGLAHRNDYLKLFSTLRRIGITTIAFTLHGCEQHHDWFVRRQGAYNDILKATRRAQIYGFNVNWQIFVDKKGIGDIHDLVRLAEQEVGEQPSLTIPYNRVGRRLRQYEFLRLELSDVKRHQLDKIIDDPKKNFLLFSERLTSIMWLQKWLENNNSDEFMHPYEPRQWPPDILYPSLSIVINQTHKVFLDPMCSKPILLGDISEGKTALLKNIQNLKLPEHADLLPSEIALTPHEAEQLHPSGFSFRYKEIMKKYAACV